MSKKVSLFAFLAVFCSAGLARTTPTSWDLDIGFIQEPTLSSRTVLLPNGEEKETKLILSFGTKLYAATQIRFPQAVPEEKVASFYQISRDNVLKSISGKVESESEIEIAGANGRRYIISHAENTRRLEQRAVLIGKNLYVIIYDAATVGYSQAEANAFFDSVRKNG